MSASVTTCTGAAGRVGARARGRVRSMTLFARVVCLIAALVVGALAARFWYGAVTGPYSGSIWPYLLTVGVFLLAVALAYVGVRGDRSRPCPRCAKRVKAGIVICPTCGFNFGDAALGSRTTAESS